MDTALLIAIYGAIISTLLAIREIVSFVNDLRKDKRRLQVSIEYGQGAKTKKKSGSFLHINITNIGNRPVTIIGVGFFSSGSIERTYADKDVFRPIKLPVKLEDGDRLDFTFDWKVLQQVLDKQTSIISDGLTSTIAEVFVEDSEGKFYTARISKKGRLFLDSKSIK